MLWFFSLSKQMQKQNHYLTPKSGNTLIDIMESLFHTLDDTHGWSLAVGGCCILLTLLIRSINRQIPMGLVLLIVITFFSWLLDLERKVSRDCAPFPSATPRSLLSCLFYALFLWEILLSISPKELFVYIPHCINYRRTTENYKSVPINFGEPNKLKINRLLSNTYNFSHIQINK
jgi:MFS superfamily sulfate permease-like transporter